MSETRVQRALVATLFVLASCESNDAQSFLDQQLSYVQLGVQLASEEKEVRRVLAQRGLRVVSRRDDPGHVALGAVTRDRSKSAIRLITRRGVVLAEDAAVDDLFAPGTLALIEHFGGQLGPYSLLAYARIPPGHDVGCVTLQRVLPDGNVVQCPLDVSMLGSRACVSNLAPGRGGHMQATVAWPSLYALGTPQLRVELALPEPALDAEPPLTPVAHLALGPWLDEEARRLSTLRLARAEFSQRHAAGVLRAAVALLSGKDRGTQVDAYRYAVSEVLPGSPEAQVVADTTAHIQRGWLDPSDDEAPANASAAVEPGVDADATVIEPERSATADEAASAPVTPPSPLREDTSAPGSVGAPAPPSQARASGMAAPASAGAPVPPPSQARAASGDASGTLSPPREAQAADAGPNQRAGRVADAGVSDAPRSLPSGRTPTAPTHTDDAGVLVIQPPPRASATGNTAIEPRAPARTPASDDTGSFVIEPSAAPRTLDDDGGSTVVEPSRPRRPHHHRRRAR